MTVSTLATLNMVDMRDHRTKGSVDFTSWLAEPGNSGLLGDTIGMPDQPVVVWPSRAQTARARRCPLNKHQCAPVGTA